MRLEELVNKYYDKLNENDKMIWQYIQANKKKCCDISIEELAEICCISRATISRFTQKLSFDGFREFKLHLKLECEKDSTQDQLLLEDVCSFNVIEILCIKYMLYLKGRSETSA